ncbi:basic secretory family protein [Niabella pedocola]|uniref:Basic secretory family protein n=1 Tax=Niabella pedocola TaxID=1752077 RepID=A0ABS8PVJ0_9BACT|nr:basic secretory family protein [Niabella pedocola]MCD2425088.1 basic secretory family protein [Niabella pedocola]
MMKTALRKTTAFFLLAFLSTGFAHGINSAEPKHTITSISDTDTIRKKGFTLIFTDKTVDMDPAQKKSLVDAFFTNYPKLIKAFNPKGTRIVRFTIDPDYEGVAAADAAAGHVSYGAAYMKKHPQDVDVVTHEVMHIVQHYPSGPGWVTEGIADYVRHTYGIDNAAINWALQPPKPAASYTNGYGTAARFFVWIERFYKKGLVKKLNATMHAGAYTDHFWIKETGKNVDQLWADYLQHPMLK